MSSAGRRLQDLTRQIGGMMASEREGKGLELLTASTPNGHKLSILLEELKEAYPDFDYTWKAINLGKDEQKEATFMERNPNGRIPVLIDHNKGGFGIFESGAIMFYLIRTYDPKGKFGYSLGKGEDDLYSQLEQWLFWMNANLGPMQGQSNHFHRYAPERIEYGVNRYQNETKRCYGLLDKRLADRDYVVGSGRGKLTIADIAIWPWVNYSSWAGVQLSDYKNLTRWHEALEKRPAFERGVAIPKLTDHSNRRLAKRMEEDPDFADRESATFRKWIVPGSK